MRFINHAGRLVLLRDSDNGVDVARASGDRLPASPSAALERWPEVDAWARAFDGPADVAIDEALIGPPSPSPRQILAVGLNYASHAQEAGMEIPEQPMIFAKLLPALAGPYDPLPLSTENVDWEVELVVVIGRRARRVREDDAWEHIAGVTVGQDFSDREIQGRPKSLPQFTLGKSLPGFAPTGPALITVDELDDRDAVELTCLLNGEEVQRGVTSDMVFSIGELIEYLSGVTVLHPGDLIFTGTPPGIGSSRTPPRFLRADDLIESRIHQVGEMRNRVEVESLSAPVGAAA